MVQVPTVMYASTRLYSRSLSTCLSIAFQSMANCSASWSLFLGFSHSASRIKSLVSPPFICTSSSNTPAHSPDSLHFDLFAPFHPFRQDSDKLISEHANFRS